MSNKIIHHCKNTSIVDRFILFDPKRMDGNSEKLKIWKAFKWKAILRNWKYEKPSNVQHVKITSTIILIRKDRWESQNLLFEFLQKKPFPRKVEGNTRDGINFSESSLARGKVETRKIIIGSNNFTLKCIP